MVEIVDSNLQIFIKKRAIFIIISIIENTSYNQMIIDKLKKIKNKLPKDQPGVEILLNLIK